MCPPPHTEPTFNFTNLSNVIESVRNLDGVTLGLGIPPSRWSAVKRKNPNKHDHYPEAVTYYINCVSGASWLGVAQALWGAEEYAPLEVVSKLYLRGKM